MIVGYSPVMQALLGTLFTWGLTAAGSGLVFFMQGTKPRILDSSLGFAAGVMTAASFWSLLAPAIEMAEESKLYGSTGEYAFIPVACGFLLGGAFVFLADHLMDGSSAEDGYSSAQFTSLDVGEMKQRVSSPVSYSSLDQDSEEAGLPGGQRAFSHQQWKRILLLIVAITVHNIP
ncbi:hypothetical protein HAZT_HAZT011941, partial [Hyalella azteca]